MTMPIFSAEASLYKSSIHYGFANAAMTGASIEVGLSQLGTAITLRTPIVCNGDCPPPHCHFHCNPCIKDSTVSTGCSRTCTTYCEGEPPETSKSECPASACCPVTCDSSKCTGGSCGTYPTCTRTSGTMPCHDCNGNPAPSQPC